MRLSLEEDGRLHVEHEHPSCDTFKAKLHRIGARVDALIGRDASTGEMVAIAPAKPEGGVS
jgi:hypothetical protein